MLTPPVAYRSDGKPEKGASRNAESKSPGGLDLGLGELLRKAEAGVPGPQDGSHPAACTADLNPDRAKEAPPASQDEYSSLAGSGSWRDLVLLCERRLAADGADLRSRLWWIRAQLRLNGMPAAVLAAPLDSAALRLIDEKGLLQDEAGADLTPLA